MIPMAEEERAAPVAALGVAWSLGWPIAAGVWIGYQLDTWLGSGALFTLVFALAALVIGVRRMLKVLNKDPDREG